MPSSLPLIPLLMLVVGSLVYALAGNPKVAELGRACAWAGLFGLALGASGVGHSIAL